MKILKDAIMHWYRMEEWAWQSLRYPMRLGAEYFAAENKTYLTIWCGSHVRTEVFDYSMRSGREWQNWVKTQCILFDRDMHAYYEIGDM